MAGDILLDMLFHASDEERIVCSTRLKHTREAPRRLLRYLAQCQIEVARELLEENMSFDDADLCLLVQTTSAEHRNAIAKRKVVSPAVVDRLASFGETYVLKTLLQNKGAVFPESALDMLIPLSRTEDSLTPLINTRLELTPSQAMTMFWWADGPARRQILQRQAADRLELVEMCADVFAMAAEEGWADPVARKTLQLIERRQRNRAAINKSPYDSLEHAVQVAAEKGMDQDLAQEIGYLAGVKPVTIAKIMSDRGGEGLAVLCKATGLKRPYLPTLWRALKRPLELEPGKVHPQFAYVMETYELLSVAKAQTTLRYWNWSLSSSFSPTSGRAEGMAADATAIDEAAFSTSQRTARLVFGR